MFGVGLLATKGAGEEAVSEMGEKVKVEIFIDSATKVSLVALMRSYATLFIHGVNASAHHWSVRSAKVWKAILLSSKMIRMIASQLR